jgi:hypothetical protein
MAPDPFKLGSSVRASEGRLLRRRGNASSRLFPYKSPNKGS